MKKTKSLLLAVVVGTGIVGLASGCSNAGGSSDAGTLTIEFVNAGEAAGTTLEMHVFEIGTDYNDPANCVAAWYSSVPDPVPGAAFSTVMKEDNGAFNPTTVDWIGEGGWGRYEFTMLFDFDGDHYITPGSGEKTNLYPAPVVIYGDTTITVDYTADLIAH